MATLTAVTDSHGVAPQRSTGSKAGAVVIVGGLTMLLLLTFELGGLLDAIDRGIAGFFAVRLGEDFPLMLPLWIRWSVAAVLAFVLPAVMLLVAERWRRVLLWIACTLVMQAWAPVLCLAAHQPQVAVVVLASLISGAVVILCARRTQVVIHHELP